MGRSNDQEDLLSEPRKYRKFSAQQKTELVLAALKGHKTIAELAREREVSETLLRRWREQFLAGGVEKLAGKAERARSSTSCASVTPASSARWGARRWSSKSRRNSCGDGSDRARRPFPRAGRRPNRVSKDAGVQRLAGTFAILAPMVRDYLRERLFVEPVELDDKVVLRRLAEADALAHVSRAFGEAIRSLAITEREPTIQESALRVSETPPFPWSRETVAREKTIFNLTPVDSSLEARFARFLDKATDVTAWAKLTMNSRFALEYISRNGALRYYYPDFVLRLSDDSCLIIETKGQEDLDVALKDRRARRWCRDSTRLAGREWGYEKAVALEQPLAVVGEGEPSDGGAELFEGGEALDPQHLLLEGLDEFLRAAVGFGLVVVGR